jgi:nitrite reductase/ring-hydroxylating ferredoxin subunit
VSEFVEGVLYARKIGETKIFVTRTNGRFYALSNICTHQGFTITPGTTDGATILCPVHDALFDIETGACISGPAADPLPVYRVSVEGEDVMVGEALVSE